MFIHYSEIRVPTYLMLCSVGIIFEVQLFNLNIILNESNEVNVIEDFYDMGSHVHK